MTKGRKYVQGEKVFAKVRGYPAWPARIVGAADELSNPNKIRYHIYFYGTGETAVVKGEDMYPFIEHRNGKLGKPRKHKGFNEAMADIEAQLTDQEREQMENFSGSDNGDISMISDDGSYAPSKQSLTTKPPKSSSPDTPKSKPSVPAETPTVDLKSNKRKVEDREERDMKKGKIESEEKEEDANTQKSDVVSRSGRKIKQKKFSDEPEVETTPKTTNKPGPARNKSASKGDNSASVREEEDFIEFSFNNETVRVPLKAGRPTFNNPKSPVTWDKLALQQAHEVKSQVLSGELPVDNINRVMEDWAREKAIELVKTFEEDDRVCASLKTEGKLLALDFKIKSALGLTKADTTVCLQHLDELVNLTLTPVMLKKHPEVVETMKRLRRYVGNTGAWNFNDEDLKEFKEMAAKIRNKADHIHSKFEALFTIPNGQTFWTIFSQQLEDFHKKTESLKEDQVFLITDEPA